MDLLSEEKGLWLRHWTGTQKIYIQILPLLGSSYVTMGKSFNLVLPPFSIYKLGIVYLCA